MLSRAHFSGPRHLCWYGHYSQTLRCQGIWSFRLQR